MSMANGMIHRIKRDKTVFKTPALFAMKGKLSKFEEKKTRVIWMFPFEIIVMEKYMATTIEKMIASNPEWLFHNGERAMGRLALLLNENIEKKSQCQITLDWKEFDTSIEPWLIDIAFWIIE